MYAAGSCQNEFDAFVPHSAKETLVQCEALK